jgi:hypothetical protein
MAEKYRADLTDPELLELRSDVALLSARLKTLLEACESLPLLEQAAIALADVETAIKKQDGARLIASMGMLKNLLQRGVADFQRWREIYELIEGMGRTKEREHRRLVAMQQMMSAEQFGAFLVVITEAAKRTIQNKQDLAAFADELSRLWNREGKPGH